MPWARALLRFEAWRSMLSIECSGFADAGFRLPSHPPKAGATLGFSLAALILNSGHALRFDLVRRQN